MRIHSAAYMAFVLATALLTSCDITGPGPQPQVPTNSVPGTNVVVEGTNFTTASNLMATVTNPVTNRTVIEAAYSNRLAPTSAVEHLRQ